MRNSGKGHGSGGSLGEGEGRGFCYKDGIGSGCSPAGSYHGNGFGAGRGWGEGYGDVPREGGANGIGSTLGTDDAQIEIL